jgi:Helix-turn-helix domain
MSNSEHQAAVMAKVKTAKQAAGMGFRSLERKIKESSLYDWNPTARFLLTDLAVMAMDEDSSYPDEAPDEYKADKVGWCWLSQAKLAIRVGVHDTTIYRWIKDFRDKGVIQYRDWHDDNMTHHAEYKVIEAVVDAFQRPSQKSDVERPPRYSKKRPSPKQPRRSGRFVKSSPILEEDDE